VPDVREAQRSSQNFQVLSPATNVSREPSAQDEERLYCPTLGCSAKFKGAYAKGSLARHRRLKHGSRRGKGREYHCEDAGCSKSFQRQDARLKHYRKAHPQLAPGPALSRTKYLSE
jgi:hypothetical protein